MSRNGKDNSQLKHLKTEAKRAKYWPQILVYSSQCVSFSKLGGFFSSHFSHAVTLLIQPLALCLVAIFQPVECGLRTSTLYTCGRIYVDASMLGCSLVRYYHCRICS